MEFIIDFFRGIDGWVYYTILVVNAILIFAIIGYIGEKSNEELSKFNANKGNSNLKNGAMNLTPVHSSSNASEASVPKVAVTQVSKPKTPVSSQGASPSASPVVSPVNNGSSSIPNINGASTPVIRPEDNAVDPNEKAPAVLVINSQNVNKDNK